MCIWIVIIVLRVLRFSEGQGFDSVSTTKPTTTRVFYAPNPGYDAYWQGGGWIYGSTLAPATYKTVTGNRVLVCGKPCARVYKKLTGPVCGHKVNNVYNPKYDGKWKNHPVKGFIDWTRGGAMDRNYDYLQTYDSYCKFKDEQCRTNIYHGMGIVFLHMGSCLGDQDAFPSLMAGSSVKQRKQVEVKRYLNEAWYVARGKICLFSISTCLRLSSKLVSEVVKTPSLSALSSAKLAASHFLWFYLFL